MIRGLNSYGEKGLYVGVQNLLLEKIILVQEKNLRSNPSARATGQTQQRQPTIDVDLNHWE